MKSTCMRVLLFFALVSVVLATPIRKTVDLDGVAPTASWRKRFRKIGRGIEKTAKKATRAVNRTTKKGSNAVKNTTKKTG